MTLSQSATPGLLEGSDVLGLERKRAEIVRTARAILDIVDLSGKPPTEEVNQELERLRLANEKIKAQIQRLMEMEIQSSYSPLARIPSGRFFVGPSAPLMAPSRAVGESLAFIESASEDYEPGLNISHSMMADTRRHRIRMRGNV